MPQNEFLPWALNPGANILTQDQYAANPAQQTGVQVGIADPALYNKAQRQTAFIGYCLGQLINLIANADALDDGNADEYMARFWAMILGLGNFTDTGATNAMVVAPPVGFTFPAPTPGLRINIKIANTNTGGVTLNYMSSGNQPVVYVDGSSLQGGELVENGFATFEWDGIHWQYITLSPAAVRRFTSGQSYAVDDSGTANAIHVVLTPAPATLSSLLGIPLRIMKSSLTNSGPVTIAVNGLTPTALVKPGGAAMSSNAIPASGVLSCTFDGTNFEILSPTNQPGAITGVQSYTVAGTYNWTVPTGVFRARVRVVGAGGGGGGAGGGVGMSGGGGGAGGYAEGWLNVTPGQVVAIAIGAGGAGSAGGVQGTAAAGGTTSFGSLMSATGGSGGITNSAGSAGGAPGVGSGGTQLNTYGAAGGDGNPFQANVQGGQGGAGAFGGGGRTSTTTSPANGLGYGCGGGGIWASGPAQNGGVGADGAVLIEWSL